MLLGNTCVVWYLLNFLYLCSGILHYWNAAKLGQQIRTQITTQKQLNNDLITTSKITQKNYGDE